MNIATEFYEANKPQSAKADSPLIRGKVEEQFPLGKGVPRRGGGFPIPQDILNSKYIIKSNSKLAPRAHSMSRNMTKPEQILWFKILSKKQLLGYKFTKQKQVFNYILDFYCSKLLLAIEVDGDTHASQVEYDSQRTTFLNSMNIKVIRVNNVDICNNLPGIYDYLSSQIKNLEKEEPQSAKADSPLIRGKVEEQFPLGKGVPRRGGGFPAN